MNHQNITNHPIGIFDSGIGGLTVAKAVNDLLPNESIVYFGDTAHLPYGDKSTSAIQAYTIKICNVLLSQRCKVILIACNSASVAAYDLVKAYIGKQAKVMNVIDPVVQYIKEKYKNQAIGLIGTKKTVSSNVYKKKIDELKQFIKLKSLATPLLVPMIEEGFFQEQLSKEIIDIYLSNENLKDIEALILGCTHYPLIKKEIGDYYKNNIEIIDSSNIVAKTLKKTLEKYSLINENKRIGKKQFYVSDYTHSFEESTKIFFRQEINLAHYPLWE